jgi:hypothetical protein
VIALLLGCRTVLVPPGEVPSGDASPAWEELLREVVSEDGAVDYHALEANRAPLDAYVLWLGRDRPRVDRDNGQHHLWLNAYAALAMYGVLEAGIPTSVDDVGGWLPWAGAGFFVEQAFVVQQEAVSLSEIKHERLRGRTMDLRDHAAIALPFRSGPPVRRELYRQADLEEQLRDQMERWVTDPARGVRVVDGVAEFNALFEQHAFDFELFSAGDDPCTLAARYFTGPTSRQLDGLAAEGCPRRFRAEDRRLNDVHPASP